MGFEALLGYLAAALALLVCIPAMWRGRRLPAYWAFTLGMVVLATREILGAQAAEAVFDSQIYGWHRLRLLVSAFVPGVWILFSITFARAFDTHLFRRWGWPLAAAFVAPSAIVTFGWESLVIHPAYPVPRWLVPVGWAGYWLHMVLLLASVCVLVNLESTLRASSGTFRWQIKFVALGIGALFGVEVFLTSQVLLYRVLQTSLLPFGSVSLVLATGFVAFSLARRGLQRFNVYPSESLVFNSIALLVVAVYLLAVAGVVQLIEIWGGSASGPLVALFVLIATVTLVLVLLSTELRQQVKRFVVRHLRRPSHDYRKLWNDFTRRTNAVVDIEPVCNEISKIVAETFGCAAASIWLAREGGRGLSLGGSTATSADQALVTLEEHEHEGIKLWHELLERARSPIIDVTDGKIAESARDVLRSLQARYVVVLAESDGELVGCLTVSERVTGQEYSVEDQALLETLANQAAATLLNRRLTRELERAKQMETFQALSAFFIHDLKNLASRLSLVMQNLPVHYEKAAFREDLLRTMRTSVEKIDAMTSRLSSVTKGLELHRVESDLNALVRDTIESLNGTLTASLDCELREIPAVRLDPEQVQKVVTNLLLNANEAMGAKENVKPGGRVLVSTSRENGWVLLSVTDNGCGMTSEFVANSLFKPFQTTKKQGLGIGLFHSRTIVEAHGGRVEVDSARGRGSTFRVFLPAGKHGRHRRQAKGK